MPQPKERIWVVEIHPDGVAHAYVDKLGVETTDTLSDRGHFRTDVRTPTRKKAVEIARERLAGHYAELAKQRLGIA